MVVQNVELRWLAIAIIVLVFTIVVWNRLLDSGGTNARKRMASCFQNYSEWR